MTNNGEPLNASSFIVEPLSWKHISLNFNLSIKIDNISSGFARDIPGAIISPNVSIYLKISYLYYIGLFFLVFLYCGLFFIAVLEICKLILKWVHQKQNLSGKRN